MNKFTNNAYDFINRCIGNNHGFRITISGDFKVENVSLPNFYYYHELKKMVITNIEIQSNNLYLIVKKENK